MSIIIDGKNCEYNKSTDEGKSIVEFAYQNEIDIPTLCFLKDCANIGKCGLCSVNVNGKKTLACKQPIADDDVIVTANSDCEEGQNIRDALQKRISLMLKNHNFACGKCSRINSCEFLNLVKFTKARPTEKYEVTDEIFNSRIDDRSASIVIDRNKCVTCARCEASCSLKTTTESIKVGMLPESIKDSNDIKRGVCPAIDGELTDKSFDESNCLLCGQCTLACPVAALSEKSHIERVNDALQDDSKHVVVAIAPSVRAALGESFAMGYGQDVTGKIYTALRELGFDKVCDINFAADVTIMEEGTELLQRLKIIEGGHSNILPMFTSCCPGWMRLVNKHAPELLPNISTTKSPQQIFGAAAKYYYPKVQGLDPKNVYVVAVMPCTAKKYEAELDGMFGASGDKNNPDIDAVLTTRELAELIKKKRIKFAELENSSPDDIMSEYTGAGTIFGITGGVMEAAIRTAADLASGKEITNVDYEAVEGFNGVREAEVCIDTTSGKSVKLNVAVVNGASNFFKLYQEGSLSKYHFVEVMACPGGCINGGGQPHISAKKRLEYAKDQNGNIVDGHFAGTNDGLPLYIAQRASVLRKQDKDGVWTDKKRKSHENQSVIEMYKSLGVNPGESIAHDLFHLNLTKY